MENKFYVYVYLDVRKKGDYCFGKYNFEYEPFYVGKGSGKRYLKHLTETKEDTDNIFKFRVINKLNELGLVPIILKVKFEISESVAYSIETELIKLIGRRCDNSGPLTNIVTDGKPPKNYKQLTDETIKKIIELYNNGEYLKHIGNKLGLNENKIKRTLIENGILTKKNPPINKIELNNELIKKISDDYISGLSIRKIQKKYDISFNIVRDVLKKDGVKLRGYDYKKTDEHIKKIWENREHKLGYENPNYKALTQEEIAKMKKLRFDDGLSIKEIIKEMKISQKKYYENINI